MDASTFSFITPKYFRNNIIESVEFVGWLWVLAQEIEDEYRDEMTRTVILYNISIIEALLLFRVRNQKIKFFEDKYSYVNALPGEFQKKSGQELVVAYRSKNSRDESRIWLHELIKENSDFLGEKLKKEVVGLQNVRNTFHLSRTRRSLSLKKAEHSFDVVLKVVEKIKKEVSKKKK